MKKEKGKNITYKCIEIILVENFYLYFYNHFHCFKIYI